MKPLLYLVGTIAIALTLFTRLVEPPHQLDILNAVWPGESGVSRVAEGVVFDNATGLKLDVWAPEGGVDPKKPVLIFYYGGGWAHGARAHYGFAGKAFAAKGFVTVVADYRKVPQVRFPAFNQDGAAAIKWTRDNIAKFGGDPSRIALAGHSAGAYIAVILALIRIISATLALIRKLSARPSACPAPMILSRLTASARSTRCTLGRAQRKRSQSILPGPTPRQSWWSPVPRMNK